MSARRVLPLIVAGGTLLALALALWLSAGRWAAGHADAIADEAAARAARSHAGLLSSELQKFRLLPLVLVEYPDVAAALEGKADARDRLDHTLELLAARTDAAAIYVIDRSGNTLAASNWAKPASFVGQNYGFRPYFRDALAHGASELFALGTISGRPGMFLARRVERKGQPIGVVVVKVEFDRIEEIWTHAAGPTIVTDPHGVILVTSQPAWRFHTTHPIDAATVAEARHTLQFGTAPLKAAPVLLDQPTPAIGLARYRRATVAVDLPGSTLVYLEPLAPALAAATTSIRLWSLIGLFALALIAGIVLRARERQALQRRAQTALEREVERRTAELREANAQLHIESRERIAADRRFREARENLTQANRLGSLGQITAGVAHEINQPVAAIRTFAENAELFLERGKPEGTRDSLTHIIALTARIGSITNELRGFARKRTPEAGAVALDTVIEGVLLLTGDRVRELVHVTMPDPAPAVFGDRVRLEQVLLNLLQNAAEALGKTPGARIEVTIRAGDPVTLLVADNGPGLAADVADDAFTPFVTGKAQGLGLGLGIARDITREFGGDIMLAPSPLGGAAFEVRLTPA
jgi:two-component system C4-dicarboxylate transport sensor histidine kinase DctB